MKIYKEPDNFSNFETPCLEAIDLRDVGIINDHISKEDTEENDVVVEENDHNVIGDNDEFVDNDEKEGDDENDDDNVVVVDDDEKEERKHILKNTGKTLKK